MSLPDYPITREEIYLNAIITGGEISLVPIARKEIYFNAILTEDASDLPAPVTRKEQYLNAIANSDTSNIPAYPITREEQFLAAIATGDTSDLPIPVTREEQYLFEWAGGSYAIFTGSIARFFSPSSKPVKSIVCNIEPVQAGSGDPSPDNVRPISGFTGLNVYGTGKNLLADSDIYVGKNYNGHNNPPRSMIYVQAPIGTYTVSVQDKSSFAELNIGRTDMVYGSMNSMHGIVGEQATSWTITTNEQYPIICVFLRNATDAMTLEQINAAQIQIELGSTATSYEAYVGTTLPVSWQSEAGTVYAGYLSIDADGNVTLTAEWIIVDGGDLEWDGPKANNYRTFVATPSPAAISYSSEDNETVFVICSQYKSVSWATSSVQDDNYAWITKEATGNLAVKDTSKSGLTAAQFQTAMTGVKFLYKLNAPLTYTLSSVTVPSTVQGENNWWHDANGNITIEAIGTPISSDEPDALQSLNILLGGAYTPRANFSEPTDEQALNIIMGGSR